MLSISLTIFICSTVAHCLSHSFTPCLLASAVPLIQFSILSRTGVLRFLLNDKANMQNISATKNRAWGGNFKGEPRVCGHFCINFKDQQWGRVVQWKVGCVACSMSDADILHCVSCWLAAATTTIEACLYSCLFVCLFDFCMFSNTHKQRALADRGRCTSLYRFPMHLQPNPTPRSSCYCIGNTYKSNGSDLAIKMLFWHMTRLANGWWGGGGDIAALPAGANF